MARSIAYTVLDGPALWTDPAGRTYVIGISQGTQTCGGRYLATFGIGGTASDGTPKPNLGVYIGQQLTIRGVDFQPEARLGATAFAKIAACDDGRMLGMNTGGRLYQWASATAGWSTIAELGVGTKDLDCHANDPVYPHASNRVIRRLGSAATIVANTPADATDLAYNGSSWIRRSDARAYQQVGTAWVNRTHGGTEIELTAGHLLTAAAWTTPGRHMLYLRRLDQLSRMDTLGTFDATDIDMHHPATSTEPIFYRHIGHAIERGVLIRGTAPLR